jgi:hypothetical protein
MQAILDYAPEATWLRHARAHLSPYLPQQRLRKAAGLMRSVNRTLATATSVPSRWPELDGQPSGGGGGWGTWSCLTADGDATVPAQKRPAP